MRRVLFVDDDEILLRSLARAARSRRGRWDVATASNAEEALRALRASPTDVIVSDVRMPGVDGPGLLAAVREEWPATVRVLMSGYADETEVRRALAVAHQFVAKPCTIDELIGGLDLACAQRDRLRNPRLVELVGRLDRLPSSPGWQAELSQALADPGLTVSRLVGLAERDAALSAKLLQLVNSAFFGAGRPAASVDQAVMHLGVEVVRGLLENGELVRASQSPALEPLMERAWLTARVARRLAPESMRDEAFTAGLLSDLGRIVISVGLPGTAREIDVGVASGGSRRDLERKLLGASHADVGAYLAALWRLPAAVVQAVAHHEEPWRCEAGPHVPVVVAAHIAASLVEEQTELDLAWLEQAGSAQKLPDWRMLVAEERGLDARVRSV